MTSFLIKRDNYYLQCTRKYFTRRSINISSHNSMQCHIGRHELLMKMCKFVFKGRMYDLLSRKNKF